MIESYYTLKVRKILEKGEDMAPSEIRYMLNRQVERIDIAKSLNMKLKEFNTWWNNYNKPLQVEHEFLNPNEYLQYRRQGLTDADVARLKFVAPPVIYKWKLKHRDEIEESFSLEKNSRSNIQLTKEEYLRQKSNSKNDEEIAKSLGIHRVTLALWKKRNFSKEEIREMSMRKRSKKKVVMA